MIKTDRLAHILFRRLFCLFYRNVHPGVYHGTVVCGRVVRIDLQVSEGLVGLHMAALVGPFHLHRKTLYTGLTSKKKGPKKGFFEIFESVSQYIGVVLCK